jgi:hypothetical protein
LETPLTVVELPHDFASTGIDGVLMSWWDPEAECTLVIAKPSDDSDLWQEYLAGAERTYRRRGVGAAFDGEAIRRSSATTAFWALLDSTGQVVGGVRAIGPLTSPDDSHAIVEWANQPELPLVRKMIADRLPFGVVEMKTAWITDDPDRNRNLAALLARGGCHVLAVLGVQFCMGTCADFALQRWRSSGGVVASIRPAPYPDERYRTKVIWWDRVTLASHAAPNQIAKIYSEMDAISLRLHSEADRALVWS